MSDLLNRRFATHFKAKPERVNALAADHPAVRENRTLFPTRVVPAEEAPRLLTSGKHQRKIGDRVRKGAWSGMPIFCLTLEERATCPDSCAHWRTCYGNGMPWPRRHEHGAELEYSLQAELRNLSAQHPGGFVVRLHILGDFYDDDYVCLWDRWLDAYPALHVFGYTAHPVDSGMGRMIGAMNRGWPGRWAVRFSTANPIGGAPMQATTIWRTPDTAVVPEGIICPVQRNRTAGCATCGLCWAPAAANKTIVFIAHGMKKRAAA